MYKNLREMMLSNRRERRFAESMTLGGIIVPLIHINKKQVFVFGGGE